MHKCTMLATKAKRGRRTNSMNRIDTPSGALACYGCEVREPLSQRRCRWVDDIDVRP